MRRLIDLVKQAKKKHCNHRPPTSLPESFLCWSLCSPDGQRRSAEEAEYQPGEYQEANESELAKEQWNQSMRTNWGCEVIAGNGISAEITVASNRVKVEGLNSDQHLNSALNVTGLYPFFNYETIFVGPVPQIKSCLIRESIDGLGCACPHLWNYGRDPGQQREGEKNRLDKGFGRSPLRWLDEREHSQEDEYTDKGCAP